MSKARKGIKFSDEHKANIKKNHKGMLGKKHKEHFKKIMSKKLKGRKMTKKWIRKLSESHRSERSYFWKGGISQNPYPIGWTETLKKSIRERDHYICQICEKLQKDEALSVHHIDYDKKNCNPDNLISLCRSCHLKTSHNRKNWIKFFSKTILKNTYG